MQTVLLTDARTALGSRSWLSSIIDKIDDVSPHITSNKITVRCKSAVIISGDLVVSRSSHISVQPVHKVYKTWLLHRQTISQTINNHLLTNNAIVPDRVHDFPSCGQGVHEAVHNVCVDQQAFHQVVVRGSTEVPL